MASRSVWSGYIRFGLVSVPVKAYTGASSGGGGISFNQLHKECNSRVKYTKTCPIHGELKADDIVSGYEFSKGQYVVIDPDEIDKLRTPSEKAIDVRAFIPPEEIDGRYYTGKNWYILPDGPAALRPYALLYKTMEEQDLAAFAQIVTGGREQLLLLRPVADLLIGSYISYSEDVKPLDEFKDEAPKVEVTPDELKLAKTLTEAMKVQDFDLAEYKDEFTNKVRELVEAKVKGAEVVAPPEADSQPAVVNLMDALKASLAQAQRAAKPAKPPRIAAPSVGSARQVRRRKTS
jgi:DNA end-binding protein Ku